MMIAIAPSSGFWLFLFVQSAKTYSLCIRYILQSQSISRSYLAPSQLLAFVLKVAATISGTRQGAARAQLSEFLCEVSSTQNISMLLMPIFRAGAYATPGDCQTLIYAPTEGNGYANLTTEYYKGITDVENYGQCCGLCDYESQCVGWSRVAGMEQDSEEKNCSCRHLDTVSSNTHRLPMNCYPNSKHLKLCLLSTVKVAFLH